MNSFSIMINNGHNCSNQPAAITTINRDKQRESNIEVLHNGTSTLDVQWEIDSSHFEAVIFINLHDGDLQKHGMYTGPWVLQQHEVNKGDEAHGKLDNILQLTLTATTNDGEPSTSTVVTINNFHDATNDCHHLDHRSRTIPLNTTGYWARTSRISNNLRFQIKSGGKRRDVDQNQIKFAEFCKRQFR